MGIPEIIAIGYFVVWGVERVFSWKHKKTRSKQVKKIVESCETITTTVKNGNGNGETPELPSK